MALLAPSRAPPGRGSRKGAGVFNSQAGHMPVLQAPDCGARFQPRSVPGIIPPAEGMMPESAWARSSEVGSWVHRRPRLCPQIHEDGVGCGLAEDEGSQGD